jgi:hypothetical protein
MRKLLFLLTFSLLTNCSFAQDPLSEKMNWYDKAKPTTNLFVHFDKNVYSGNETVWFSGYLIRTRDIRKHHIMSVSLVNDKDNKVVLEDRFVMKNGFSFGNITLPDSIPAGNYRFLVITDYTINKHPEVSFSQPITIKSMLEPAFKASMKIVSTENKTSKILVSVTTADSRFLPKPTEVTYTYGKAKQTIKTDASGQALLILEQQDHLTDPNVYVKLTYEKDSTFLNMALPQPKSTPSVKFYPEGGNMVSSLINNVGWEVKDQQRNPIAVKAYLYKNNKVMDTLNTNNHGLGSFKIFAEEGAQYTLKVISPLLKDTAFVLPEPKNNGIGLNITNAVVNDTLKLNLRAKQHEKLNLRVHNFRESFLYTKFELQAGMRSLKIPLSQVPKGLATVTITDSLDRPITERLFFAHYDNTEKINITTDKPAYGIREKVDLSLKLQDFDETTVVSVAVVQDNRIDQDKMKDIESYTYLNNELNNIPIHTKGSTYKDKKYLEQLLLIKGWRRYNWQELANTQTADTAKTHQNLLFLGAVTKSKKPLTKSVAVGAMGDDRIRLVSTEENGTFDFNNSELYTASGKKMFFFLNNNTDPSYKFTVANQLVETSERIAKLPRLEEKLPPLTLADNSDLFIKSTEKAIRLKEVVISEKVKPKGGFGPNSCGDYVCPYGILNCQNHYGDPKNTQPIKGKTYKSNGQTMTYNGCNVSDESIFFKTEGIHIHKEFYADTYKDPLEPAYFSTIFWNHSLILGKDKPANLSFYTSDIVGKFRVVVQGISQNQVLYSEKFFEVKRK